MRRHFHAHHALRAAALATGVAVLGASALPSHAAGSSASWRALFPPAAAYPHGARVQPVQTSARADALVDPATATQVVGLGFTTGGTQYATLRAQALVGVTVLVFRTERGAATFLRQDQPSALADPTTPGTTARGLGAGARYVSGGCAGCGAGAPPLGILLLRRGAAMVQILTQPPDHALAVRLGHAALRR
jgi:hypothetical protein